MIHKKNAIFTALFALFLLIINLAFPSLSLTDIYKYVDKQGVVHLTNVPTDVNAQYVLVLREKRVQFNTGLGQDVEMYDTVITKAAKKYNVDSALIKAVIKAESNFNPQAVSPVGACGLMQLMPATASSLEVQDSFHPEKNIEGGVRYLRYLLNLFNGDLPLTLAAYNAGEGAVARYNNSIPPYEETHTYIQRVLNYLNKYSSRDN
ncbi:MAG: lytic transglycosylase [Syntrophobacterales bacterium CG_4_8_14_3_um_filter_49_14]|nr:MAG: lytic transglycosylase [Syntrophobacterales bacterium CG_4_8_14_3_um_filter_49_14]